MNAMPNPAVSSVESFPLQHSTNLTDELNRILRMLQDIAPKDATISFDFDGRLHVHIDVRKREEGVLIEALLPTLRGGLFHSLARGATPNHPFFHRISALVGN